MNTRAFKFTTARISWRLVNLYDGASLTYVMLCVLRVDDGRKRQFPHQAVTLFVGAGDAY